MRLDVQGAYDLPVATVARARPVRLAGAAAQRAPAPLLVVAAAFSVQGGAAVATSLFDRAGPIPVAWTRSAFGALVLLALGPRALGRVRSGPLRWVLALGLTLATMNALFYESIARIPLAVAVTAEFVGPLAVAVLGSRRFVQFVWVVFAGTGVVLLGSPTADVDHVGLAFALGAGFCWAWYIVFAKRVTAGWPLATGLTLTLVVAAVALAPLALALGHDRLASGHVLGVGLAVATLSTVVPYVLELAALRRLRTSTFGILMSLEPAVAALLGALVLAQRLSLAEAIAVVLVVVASIGANREMRQPLPPEA
jgi:inner membrane transporter RhtA